MAHASTREKGVLQMKKVRKARSKRKIEKQKMLEEMTPEELIDYNKRVNERTLKSQVQTMFWDYEHNQLPEGKFDQFKEILKERKEEMLDKTLLITDIDAKRAYIKRHEEEFKKIEGILDGIFSGR